MSSKPLSMSFQMPCESHCISVIRLAVSGIANHMNFDMDTIEDIKIAISEACTNVIQHAYSDNKESDATDIIDIIATIHKDKLELIVKDYGCGFDFSTLGTEEQKQKSQNKIGLGLGLTFIKELMDDMDLSSEVGSGTTVRMVKKRP